MSVPSLHGSRRFAAASGILLGLVVTAATVVGLYALSNPNHIQFGAPWPLASEVLATAVAAALALAMRTQRRRARPALFALEVGATIVALLVLAAVAFVLSFNRL